MDKQDKVTSDAPQGTPSREELEQHVRARAWKDDTFRQEFLANPKAVLQRDYAQYFPEGQIPSGLSIEVIEEDEQAICFVLPPKVSADQLFELKCLDDEELLGVSGGKVTPASTHCSGSCTNWNTCHCTSGECKAIQRGFPDNVVDNLRRMRLR